MTQAARDRILARIRSAQGKPPGATPEEWNGLKAYLSSGKQGPRPGVGSDLVARFVQKAEALSSTVDIIHQDHDVPAAVARYLKERDLPAQIVAWAQLQSLEWAANGISVSSGRAAIDGDKTGVTGGFCAIAETGTLALLSSPEEPNTVSLLPDTHIAVLPMSRIVHGMEEAWALMRKEVGKLPRSVSFISGPSRTADIQMFIVLGAHGPYRVHIILIDDRAAAS